MAPITKTLALAGAFFALTGYAAPVAKRAVVWETVTDVVWTTVDVTTTLYPNQAPTSTATIVPVNAAAVPTTQAAVEEKKVEPTTTSAVAPAPAPATTEQAETTAAPAPAPATTEEAETTTPAPAPAPEPTTSSAVPATTPSANVETTASTGYTGACSLSSPCDGDITYYDTATTSTNPSSCGTTNDGTTENVLALPVGIMKDGDCGKSVTIEYNGVTATGTVVDKCMGCDDSSIDLSRHLFGQLASMGAGRVTGAKWYIN
ncbi:uncharacterized protein N7446_000736 [Penicillium canescens]|uniref:Allergen Asp f 7 n=1 Tax=Penicillium canescens TaxID=5083 RepID=A0AAD6I3N8_PENCN|nr:uncharacterized protein N7446_000736 [Penicillium canescens]KAJ6030203.1 hypothetical protein N7460_010469 [Penicillium canescens]KAJ6060578.1 hypothetical protein N7444_002432 [Penicillium canescens]KAJ6077800.1 hypothetical protein N7446_000736 [Penicillium canescens]